MSHTPQVQSNPSSGVVSLKMHTPASSSSTSNPSKPSSSSSKAKGKAKGKAKKPAAKAKGNGKNEPVVKAERKRAEKKVYDLPGQSKDTPVEVDCVRMYYESLHAEFPDCEVAEVFLMKNGLLPVAEAIKAAKKHSKKPPAKKRPAPAKKKAVSKKKPAKKKPTVRAHLCICKRVCV
jgi:hypothetical protein